MSVIHKAYRKLRRIHGYTLNDLKSIDKLIGQAGPINRIITYHGISQHDNTDINSRFIGLKRFEEQMALFASYFNTISLEAYFNNDFSQDKPNVAITFDDGYQNNLTYALPILEKYNIPATFYITTIGKVGGNLLWSDHLDVATYHNNASFRYKDVTYRFQQGKGYVNDKKNPLKGILKDMPQSERMELLDALPGTLTFRNEPQLSDFWKLLDEKQIKKLSDSSLVTIGAHGLYHNCLERIPLEDAKNELEVAKQFLESIVNKNVVDLAFPDGSFSEKVVELALGLGYQRLVSVDSFMSYDLETPKLKSRMASNPHISSRNQLISIIKRKYL